MTYDFPKQSVAQSKSFLRYIALRKTYTRRITSGVPARGYRARDAGYIYGD